jgi:MFS family permease
VSDAPSSSDPLPFAARRAIVGLGVSQIIAWGSVYYVIGVIGPTLVAALGTSPEWIYGGFSLSLVVGAAAAPAVGRAIDAHGGRKVMSAGSLVAAAGLALTGAATGPWSYLLACLVLGLAAALTLYDPAFAALVQIAGRRSRRAITLLTLFGGFASTVSWPLTSWLAGALGWRETYFAYAAAHVLICLPIHWLTLVDGPDQRDFAPASAAEPGGATADGALQGGARRAAFWLFAAVLTVNSFVFSGMSVHFLKALDELGLDARTAVLVGMAVGPAQVLGRFIEMLSGARHSALTVGRASAALLPVGLALLIATPHAHALAFGYALTYGLANGLITIAKGAVSLHLFGARGYGAMLGLLSAPSLAARAAAPILFSAVLSRTDAITMLALSFAISLLGLAAMEALTRLAGRAAPPAQPVD